MKPEDKVVIEVSLRELARVYAVMGRVNGKIDNLDVTLWEVAGKHLDPFGRRYAKFMYSVESSNTLDYNSYQDKWESLFFDDETTQKIKELEATIAIAQQQIQKLKESK